MSYMERRALVEDTRFHAKLQMALWIAAVDVLNDSNASAPRRQWANRTLRGAADADAMRRVAIRASANATIGAAGINASDSDIQFVVNGMVDELAS